jgi:hypothetical protein
MPTARDREQALPESWLRWQAAQDPRETRLRLAGFRAILAGRAVTARELAAEAGHAPGEVAARLRQMAARGLVELDDRGGLVGAWGLTTRPTGHGLRVDGRDLYVWCAVDAIGIPAALGADARVESRCAGCGRPVVIELVGGTPAAGAGERVRVWVADVVPGRAMAGDT